MLASRAPVSMTEFIGLRCGFSIYGGWLTAATILNISIVFKDLGLSDENGISPSEDIYTVIMLWVALAVYITVSYMERNPLYGAIYLWVLYGIMEEQSGGEYTNII